MAHCVAHGGKIHDGWHTGEILKQNAGGHEGNSFSLAAPETFDGFATPCFFLRLGV
jgi:hypothetical protein